MKDRVLAAQESRFADCASYIRIHRETLSPQQVLFHGVEFRLDRDLLARCQRARARGETLKLPANLLTDLRHYAMFADAIAFSTAYRDGDREEIALRSLISLDGAISCQICNAYLQDEALILSLTASHHWLTQQILRGLPFQAKRRVEWLAWGLALLSVAAILLGLRSRLPLANPLLWLLAAISVGLLYFLFVPLVRQTRQLLRRWYWQQLLFGRYARSDCQRNKALRAIENLRPSHR